MAPEPQNGQRPDDGSADGGTPASSGPWGYPAGPTATGPQSTPPAGKPDGAPSAQPYAPPSSTATPPYLTGAQASAYPAGVTYPPPTQPAAPPYGQPPAGPWQAGGPAQGFPPPQQSPAQRPAEGLAIAALVTGICGLGLLPIAFGAFGLARIRKHGFGGRGMAIAGIVLGAIGLVAWVAFTVLVVQEVQGRLDLSGRINPTPTTSAPTRVDTYGDDPVLDALWDACSDGDGAACDDLYWESPIGSEYESFGDSCGDRFTSFVASCERELG